MKPCNFCNSEGTSWYPVAGGVKASCRVCHGTKLVRGVAYTTDAIFASNADALVVPVNTVGAMGAGLAKAFARRYPDLASAYAIQCAKKRLIVGTLFYWRAPDGKTIVCLPTKRDWREPSRVEDVARSLLVFRRTYDAFDVTSVSLPQLGCGLGGLDWENQVKPLMENHLADLPILVRVHLKGGDP